MSRQKLVQRLLLPGNPAAVQPLNANNAGFVGNGTELSSTNTTSTATMQQATATKDGSMVTNTTANTASSQVPFLEMETTTTETEELSAKGIKTKTKYESKSIKTTLKQSANLSNSSREHQPEEQDEEEEDETDCQTNQLLLCSPSSAALYTTGQDQQQQQFVEQDMLKYLNDCQSGPSSAKTVDSAFDECSSNYLQGLFEALLFNAIVFVLDTSFLNSLSPMNLLRETSSNSRWLEENINDFSLTSLLGHLDEINASRDVLVRAELKCQ